MFNDEMVTDSLIRYIQAIQRGRRTGLLVVKRGNGNTQEEGRVRFKQGHVIETRLGHRTGTEAFNELCTWSNCLVSFVSNDGKEMKMSIAPSPSPSPQPTSPPEQTSAFPPGSSPLRRKSSAPLGPANDRKENAPQQEPSASLQARPFQTRQFNASLQIIETTRLSRAHRQIFLLINGQRSIEELIHLSARSPDEVLQLLRDLERVAVIRI